MDSSANIPKGRQSECHVAYVRVDGPPMRIPPPILKKNTQGIDFGSRLSLGSIVGDGISERLLYGFDDTYINEA